MPLCWRCLRWPTVDIETARPRSYLTIPYLLQIPHLIKNNSNAWMHACTPHTRIKYVINKLTMTSRRSRRERSVGSFAGAGVGFEAVGSIFQLTAPGLRGGNELKKWEKLTKRNSISKKMVSISLHVLSFVERCQLPKSSRINYLPVFKCIHKNIQLPDRLPTHSSIFQSST